MFNSTGFRPGEMIASCQRGVALITALLIVSLAVVAAVHAFSQHYIQLRLVETALHENFAHGYLRGAEEWAVVILHKDRTKSDVDHEGEDWAQELPSIPVDGGFVSGRVRDLQGRFNLNNLVDAAGKPSVLHLEVFGRMLARLRLNPGIAYAALDWLDVDHVPRPGGGAEDGYYLRKEPPYRAANRPFASPTELRLLKGVDAEGYRELVPLISTLPRGTHLNVNTAPAAVLSGLADGLNNADGRALVEQRLRIVAYENVDEFLKQDLLASKEIVAGLLGVSSEYFAVYSSAGVGRVEAQLVSALSRVAGENIVVLSRSSGQL